jgi:hypothetical protein
MTAFKNAAFPAYSAITIAIDTLAPDALALSTTEIDNSLSSNRYDFISVNISLNSFSPASGAPLIEGWLVPSFDGTNYVSISEAISPKGGGSVPSANGYVSPSTGAKRALLAFGPLLNLKYKLLLKNSTGTAFATGTKVVSWSGTMKETAANTVITVPPVTSDPFILFAAGDIDDQTTSSNQMATMTNSLMSANPNARFVCMGDLNYPNGTLAGFNNDWHPKYGGIKSRTIPCPGNHEYQTQGATGYFGYWSSLNSYYRTVLDANWVIYSLNSNVSTIATSPQGTWLSSQLAAETRPGIIFQQHHATRTSGANHGPDPDSGHVVDMARQYKASIVLCGHNHQYERFSADVGGVVTFVNGLGGMSERYLFGTATAGSQVRYSANWGTLKLELGPTSFTYTFIPLSGTFTDTGTLPMNV